MGQLGSSMTQKMVILMILPNNLEIPLKDKYL